MNGSRVAFDNVIGQVFAMNEYWWNKGITASRDSPRRRIILPVHRTQDAPVQRMFNFLQPGTYIRPHRHPGNEAIESLVILKGEIDFFTFDNEGKIRSHTTVGNSITNSVLDVEPGIWHTFIVKISDTVLFEVKRGPYNPMTDKEFASWAPEEGSVASSEYVTKLTGYQ